MRYSVYKFLVGLSDSIIEAILHVKENPTAVSMLADSVEAMFAIKSTLVSNEDTGIPEMDDFFDKVEEISNCVEKNTEYANMLNELYDLALVINKYCKDDIEYKIKVVFFAELGSKWDAMDSVYKAFKNREDCEVDVVLAPIYRAVKFPNGEIKSDVIYEDYLTPMGISHIPFNQYDIKKEMPDLAFTSQPYESVTTEQFWAENIAPYTRLVYLPYFTAVCVLGEGQKYTHCQMPIHQLAWRVICQTQIQKEVYSKYSPIQGKNMIVTGLPKWDYVVNMNDRKIDFPKEWEKIKGKKIILRNCHYNIKKPEAVFDMIDDTMQRVEGTDIAVLFRFHPMMETMFNVYYSEYKEKWEEVKGKIISSKNMAIDNNISYEYAFEYSSLLLTGQTSLIYQYLHTKKPVVLMYSGNLKDSKILENEKEFFVKPTELYSVDSVDEAYDTCYKILSGDDFEYDKRMKFIENFLPNADGHIGEKLSQYLIDEMIKEDALI